MAQVTRPTAEEYPPFYKKYVDRVPQKDLLTLLPKQVKTTTALLQEVTEKKALFRYAPEKWSIKEVVGHMADTERIMACRALRIARGDQTRLPGFDENMFVENAGFNRHPLGKLLENLEEARRSTVTIVEQLTTEMLKRQGSVSGHQISVRALVYIVAGHERHHVAVLKERYGVRG